MQYAVLLAGGSGTRFWPLSRRSRPKQLLSISEARSLLRITYERIAPLFPAERVFVVTAGDLAGPTRREIPEIPGANVLAEPAARNTAPAVGLAAAAIAGRDPDAVLAVLPADHHVADEPAFREAVRGACALAAAGRIVCLGVRPSRPETGFGYLEVEPRPDGTLAVARFVEKPDLPRARAFFAEPGRYLWNSGTFFFRADAILAAIGRHLPDLAAALGRFASGESDLRALYAAAPSISIDFGVMEKEKGLAALPLAAGWNDLGSWEALAEVHPADESGNVATSDVLPVDAAGCVVHAPGKLVALLGVHDLVVVDTPDAILVCPRERAQDVRRVVEALAARRREDLL
jgi:mannose-1-phosphate guanylyltransferase